MNMAKKYRVFIATAAVVLVAAGGIFYFRRNGEQPYEFVVAERGTVVQEVSVTGKVKPSEDVELAFEESGRVAAVYVKVGDRVTQGQDLIARDTSGLQAELRDAEANLAAQRAKLAELKVGTRVEEVQVKRTELAKVEEDLANYYRSVFDTVSDAYTKANDAVRKQADQLFTNDEEANPQLTFTTNSMQAEIDVEARRAAATGELNSWKANIDTIAGTTPTSELNRAISQAGAHLAVIAAFLDRAMDAVVNAVGLSQTTADTYKANLNTGQTNVNTASKAVNTLEQNIFSQMLAVKKIEDELTLKLAGATAEQVAAQEAYVNQAEAKAELIRTRLAKATVRSPLSGIVTRQDAKVGEIAVANASLVAVIADAEFEIEANVPEVDVAKIGVGDEARVTLDAYGSDQVFRAHVVEIDPAETIVEGVPTYKTTLQFVEKDSRIKSGMTANIDIVSGKQENVVAIPARAVISKEGSRIVRFLNADGTVAEKPVIVGLRGSDGSIEILEGVNEGDRIITFLK